MSVTGEWHEIISGDGPCWKIIYEITSTGEDECLTDDKIIGDMLKVCLKKQTKYRDNKLELTLDFSLTRHELASQRTIRADIVSDKLKYSENAVAIPEMWSEWTSMGTMKPTTEGEIKGSKVYMFSVDIFINVYEVKVDTIGSKLYTDSDFTDFNLCTTDGSVSVHKACMAAISAVFRAMLTNEWKETTEGQIDMKGVTVQTLQHLKDYMYLGTVPDEGLRPLLLIARLYLIEDLEKHCIRKLAAAVEPDGLFSLIEFACENQIPELPFVMMQLTRDSVVNDAHQMKIEWKKLDETKDDKVKAK